VVALKAVLLAVADRRMAGMVVGLSSFFSLCFFSTLFSSASLFFFYSVLLCFSRCSSLSRWFCCCLAALPVLVAVERKPGDNNCSFLSAAAPSLQFLAFSPVSGVSFCQLFVILFSFFLWFLSPSSLVLLLSGGSAVVGSADGGGMAVVPGGEARFFFFSLQRCRLLPFLQWCCNVWGEDGELGNNDNGVGSMGVFVFSSLCFRASPSSSLLSLFPFLSSYSLCSPLVQKFPPLFSLLSFFPLSLLQKKKNCPFLLFPPSFSFVQTPPLSTSVESSIYRANLCCCAWGAGERPAVAHGGQGTPGEVSNGRGCAGHACAVF
jgi:hypothetical protein